jgi:hypothetical protein
MLASQLRDSIGFSSVQPTADKHSKDRPGVPEPKAAATAGIAASSFSRMATKLGRSAAIASSAFPPA